jgi:hypothetical protein
MSEFPQSPNPDCLVCVSTSRIAAMSMRELGATTEEISTATGLDSEDIDRHFRDCVPPAVADHDPHSASDAELEALLRHSTELYYGATLQNNLVAASSSLNVRLRVLNEMAERGARREKHEELLEGADPCDPDTWPAALAHFIRLRDDDLIRRLDAANLRRELETA